jgi:hypothetical protein
MLKFAEVAMIATDKIEFVEGNRDVAENHKEKMKSLIEDYGFADTIKVMKQGRRYYALEGQHRLRALTELGAKSVPCSVIDWLDAEDFDEVQNFIISMNAHNKQWNLYDYVKSYSDKGMEEYKHLRHQMITYSKTISNGVVATIYDGALRGHNQLKQGNLKFINREFSDHLVENISKMVSQWGKTNLPAQVLRKSCYLILSKEEPYAYLRAFKLAVSNHLSSSKEPIPDGDESVAFWFNNTVEETYKLLKSVK